MTAPDPRLADLIAAHQLVSTDTIFHRNGMVQRPECKCGELMQWAGAYPAHLALVVEQHTNGRIAELEATIARVREGAQMLVESFQRVERGGNHLYDASTHRCADNLALLLAEAQGPEHLRAALEGES